MDSVTVVLSSVKQTNALECCLDIPSSVMKEIQQSKPTEDQCREEMTKYWLEFSPFATWDWLAGSLYQHEEETALRTVKPFLRHISGKKNIAS